MQDPEYPLNRPPGLNSSDQHSDENSHGRPPRPNFLPSLPSEDEPVVPNGSDLPGEEPSKRGRVQFNQPIPEEPVSDLRPPRPQVPQEQETLPRPRVLGKEKPSPGWSQTARGIRQKLSEVHTLRPSDLPWLLRKWWRGSGWFGRIAGILIAFTLLGMLMQVAGCNQPKQIDQQILTQSGNNKTLADLIDQTTSNTRSASSIQSSNTQMGLRVVYQSDPKLIALYTTQGLSAVDEGGTSWKWTGGCWQKGSKGESASPLAVALPLNQDNIRFSDPTRSGQTWTVPFRADNLGSWGAGDGNMTIRNNRLEEFSYQTDDGTAPNRFIITYPKNLKRIKIDPHC